MDITRLKMGMKKAPIDVGAVKMYLV